MFKKVLVLFLVATLVLPGVAFAKGGSNSAARGNARVSAETEIDGIAVSGNSEVVVTVEDESTPKDKNDARKVEQAKNKETVKKAKQEAKRIIKAKKAEIKQVKKELKQFIKDTKSAVKTESKDTRINNKVERKSEKAAVKAARKAQKESIKKAHKAARLGIIDGTMESSSTAGGHKGNKMNRGWDDSDTANGRGSREDSGTACKKPSKEDSETAGGSPSIEDSSTVKHRGKGISNAMNRIIRNMQRKAGNAAHALLRVINKFAFWLGLALN